jgi:hypothetical protein
MAKKIQKYRVIVKAASKLTGAIFFIVVCTSNYLTIQKQPFSFLCTNKHQE